MKNQIKIVVNGKFACFTRPECKADKMSYDVLTPSAARNILQAIYWKPEMDYVIKEIHVLNPIKFASFKLNEISTKGPIDAVQDYREQTNNLFLQDVSYGIVANVISHKNSSDTIKHLEMFKRRAKKGQSFSNPYLGLREFMAEWEYVEKIPKTSMPADQASKPLGPLLLDFKYIPDPNGKVIPKRANGKLNSEKQPHRMEGVYFHAVMRNGIIEIPNLKNL